MTGCARDLGGDKRNQSQANFEVWWQTCSVRAVEYCLHNFCLNLKRLNKLGVDKYKLHFTLVLLTQSPAIRV